MSTNEKKEFLDLYLLQQVKINRLNYLIKENPSRKERYISQINAAEALRERIELAIENIDGGVLSEVLCQKYLCGKSLEETALTHWLAVTGLLWMINDIPQLPVSS